MLVFAGSWITSELGTDYRELHMQFGYVLLGLLVFRLIWGLVGSEHARFTHFPLSPRAMAQQLRSLTKKNSPPAAGHTPLGSVMVLAMLALLLTQVITGLLTSDDIFYDGPYVAVASSATVDRMSSLHHSNFEWLKWLVVIHVCAIAFYWFGKRVNLLRPIVHAPLPTHAPSPQRVFVVALVSAALAVMIIFAPTL